MSENINRSVSRVLFTKKFLIILLPSVKATSADLLSLRYGDNASLLISVKVGDIIKKVKKSAIANNTWFGGVD